jgi:hypothetical protein
VQRLLDQADVSSSAPQQIREVAAWAARRKADLEWRIEVITAAEGQSGPGLRTMRFEFANATDARNAGRGEGKRVADLLAHLKSPAKSKRFRDELERLKKHAGDSAYASALFARLGPLGTLKLIQAAHGARDGEVVGRMLALAHQRGSINDQFLALVVKSLLRQQQTLYRYTHPNGSMDAKDARQIVTDTYVRRSGAGKLAEVAKYLEAVGPLVPLLEAGAKVAIVGGAIVLLVAGTVCVLASDGTLVAPATAMAGEAEQLLASHPEWTAETLESLEVATARGILEPGRLTEAEEATVIRLKQVPELWDRDFWTSEHKGAEYIDDLGRSLDAMGAPRASQYWNEEKFLNAIHQHLLKSNDFTVIDLTGFTAEQVAAVNRYLGTLDEKQLAKVIKIGFR